MENGTNSSNPQEPEAAKQNSGSWTDILSANNPENSALAVPEQPPVPAAEETVSENKEEEIRKSSVGCISTISYVIFILGAAILLSVFVIFAANDMFALVKAEKAAEITITDEDNLKDIAALLEKEGIIKYSSLFATFAKLTDMAENISPGMYELSSSMDYRTILSKIKYKSTARATVTIAIPEGMEQKEIFALLEENGVCKAWELKSYAQYFNFTYSFVKDLPKTENRLEGYLFPDTYTFYVDDSPSRVIRKFLANYSMKWSVELKARLENINMSMHDIVIIASMIEKEAKFDDERPTIASVIYNRLASSNFPNLEIDATVLYALGFHKEKLTDDDLKIDSPYNTYVCEGLPVGPICNPGLAAIKAALYPEETQYYYYVARKNGYHFFAKTSNEHRQNITKANTEVFDETPAETTANPSIEG